jgi:pyruvate dehydrogenase complex dehydrogenase (E1) component
MALNGDIGMEMAEKAIKKYKLDPEKPNPIHV